MLEHSTMKNTRTLIFSQHYTFSLLYLIVGKKKETEGQCASTIHCTLQKPKYTFFLDPHHLTDKNFPALPTILDVMKIAKKKKNIGGSRKLRLGE